MRRLLLGGATVLVLGLLVAPSLIESAHTVPAVTQETNPSVQEVVLEVQGMTCEACSQAVVYALQRLEGVRAAEVTLEPPEARVRFEAEKVSVAQLIETIRSAGFDAHLKANESL
nr:cation transporter [Rhodothermus profundi]